MDDANSIYLIPRNRLDRIPKNLLFLPECWLFVSDEGVLLQVECKAVELRVLKVQFRNEGHLISLPIDDIPSG